METLNEQDLDWLTKAENRMIRMRKREAAFTDSRIMIEALTETIEQMHQVRQWLQSRFGQDVDKDLNPFVLKF